MTKQYPYTYNPGPGNDPCPARMCARYTQIPEIKPHVLIAIETKEPGREQTLLVLSSTVSRAKKEAT